jgi:hypothetical protein
MSSGKAVISFDLSSTFVCSIPIQIPLFLLQVLVDKKRELVNLVFQSLKLEGKKNAHGGP